MKRPRLAKLELRILEVLWGQGSASMREIQEAFPEPRPAYTTITNTVYRMEAKRAVRRVRKVGNADIFEPLIAKDAARDGLLDEILSFFGGRPQPMMAQLVESGRLTLEDIRELEKPATESGESGEGEMTVPFIANHLWQSSGFALAGGLLAFVLRRNSPRVRYWIWLSASLKFLVPFALLVSVGSLIPRAAPHTVSVPFPLFPNTVIQIAAPLSAASDVTRAGPTELYWLPVALGVIWALGFLAITLVRWRGWLRVRALLRAGTPIELQIPVRALITPGAEEPGVVGFLRPVLVLPAQLLERLNARQLGAILAHELCHVRRRDNFFAAVHMVVEAIFWFNPLVWWIGSRMVEERELACDEEVLRTGCEPADYVEGILQVCRFYTESPLPCFSGVTGADVKKRLSAILAGTIALELSGAKKLTLATISVAVLTTPVLVGVLTAPVVRAQNATATVKFEVASIKLYKDDGVGDRGLHNSYRPQSVGFRCSLAFAIGDAYNFPVGRIVAPGSLTKEALWGALQQIYDIEARAEEPVSKAQLRL